MHYDYSLVPYKVETQREMLSNYQLKIADDCDISNVKKLIPDFFDNEKYKFY